MVIRGFLLVLTVLPYYCLAGYVESLAANANTDLLEDRIQAKFEPQIAVRCGYLNQFLLENGHWAVNKDGDATCQTRKEEILLICRKAYPDRQITNIVESSRNVLVENMCRDGESSVANQCKSPHNWVKPYRCIEGNFQSDALLVPEGCNFSHTYDKRQCKDFTFWNQTAQEACALKGLMTRSFGVLVPCGIDLFSGVEYVCCPLEMEEMMKDASSVSSSVVEEERSRSRHSSQHGGSGGEKSASSSKKSIKAVVDGESGDNWEDDYFRGDDEQTEHEKYKAALEKLKKHHQDRVDKMMRDWTDVANRYKDLKKSDPEAAKKLKTDLMTRVRKTMAALLEEFDDQKRQLVELHQQRIEVRLNDRKRESMDHYLDAIQETHPHVNKLLSTLEKYIKAEEKDRQHSLNRFRHLLNTDADAAEEEEPTVLSHLRDLDQRINESMKMLNRVPSAVGKEVERKARISWEELRNQLFGYGITNDELVTQYKQSVTAHRQRDHISRQRKLEDQFDQLEELTESEEDDDLQNEPESEKEILATGTAPPPTTTTNTLTTAPIERHRVIDKEGLSHRPRNKLTVPVQDVEIFATSPATTTTTVAYDDEDDTVEDETADTTTAMDDDDTDELDATETERESETVDLRKLQDVSAIANAKLHRMEEPQYSSLQRIVPEPAPMASKILYVGLGLAGVALLAFISLAIVLLRRRNPVKEGFAPVDTFASPEEKHVANMQAHGYTNPFFNHAHQYSKA